MGPPAPHWMHWSMHRTAEPDATEACISTAAAAAAAAAATAAGATAGMPELLACRHCCCNPCQRQLSCFVGHSPLAVVLPAALPQAGSSALAVLQSFLSPRATAADAGPHNVNRTHADLLLCSQRRIVTYCLSILSLLMWSFWKHSTTAFTAIWRPCWHATEQVA